MFTIDGFGSAMAAVSPDGAEDGYVMYQPYDPSTYEALDPVVQYFSADGGAIVKEGTSETAITMATAGTGVRLMSDPLGRVWLGLSFDGEVPVSRFFLIDRKPPVQL